MKEMPTLLPISVTIARVQAMKRGPSFPCLTNKKTKKTSTQSLEDKEALQLRLKNLVNKMSIPIDYKNMKSALQQMRKEISNEKNCTTY